MTSKRKEMEGFSNTPVEGNTPAAPKKGKSFSEASKAALAAKVAELDSGKVDVVARRQVKGQSGPRIKMRSPPTRVPLYLKTIKAMTGMLP